MLSHEKLQVYGKAPDFVSTVSTWTTAWSPKHAVVDQPDRAAQSIVLNIAEVNGRYAELDYRRFVQVSEGAAVKAAVYLDLCAKRGIRGAEEVTSGKEQLRKISVLPRVLTNSETKRKTKWRMPICLST